MKIEYRWIKDERGALEADFVAPIVQHCGLTGFLETGTYRGDTLENLRPLFKRFVSIELCADLASAARDRFADDGRISIIEGDSASGLEEALDLVAKQRCLVWLDAHYSGGETARGDTNTPIISELDQMLSTRAGQDLILIDDLRNFWSVRPGFLQHIALSGYPNVDALIERFDRAPADYDLFVLGDALLAAPARFKLKPSPVQSACRRSRLGGEHLGLNPEIESRLKRSEGAERNAIVDLPEFIFAQSEYGLGGHFFAWRGVIFDHEGKNEEAAKDLELARRCGVIAETATRSYSSDQI